MLFPLPARAQAVPLLDASAGLAIQMRDPPWFALKPSGIHLKTKLEDPR